MPVHYAKKAMRCSLCPNPIIKGRKFLIHFETRLPAHVRCIYDLQREREGEKPAH